MSARPVVLIDGSSYIYRAYHVPALQRLSDSKGNPTGAVHGILNMTNRLLADYEPEKIAVVFDAGSSRSGSNVPARAVSNSMKYASTSVANIASATDS